MTESDSPSLYDKLLTETARVSWPELERLFAAGRVVKIATGLDLVETARVFADDDANTLRDWMRSDQAGVLDDETAARWASDESAELWAVVVRPWVLVQEREPA